MSAWWLVHWPLMGGLLHLVQRRGAWAGWGPTQSAPRGTKCNSPPINGHCSNFTLFDVALWLPVPVEGLTAHHSTCCLYWTEKVKLLNEPCLYRNNKMFCGIKSYNMCSNAVFRHWHSPTIVLPLVGSKSAQKSAVQSVLNRYCCYGNHSQLKT